MTSAIPPTKPNVAPASGDSTVTLSIENEDTLRVLLGVRDEHVRRLEAAFGVRVVIRNQQLVITGNHYGVQESLRAIAELRKIADRTKRLTAADVERHLPVPPMSSDSVGSDSETNPAPAADSTNHHRSQESTPESARPASRKQPIIELGEGRRRINPRTPGQANYVKSIQQNEIVFCQGPAGSGKTYLAVAMALSALRRELIRKIVLVRPAVEAGEKLGFLPGDMLAKVNPYLRPLLDALQDMLSYEQLQRYRDHDVIEIVPLAFMRGRTLNDTFMILDEAQNTTITQMKMFLTRMGEGSRIVVTGDATQQDLPDNTTSGLSDSLGRLANIPGIGIVRLQAEDIVRHHLVRKIVAAYDDQATPSA